jgi:hypothetical protein
MRGVAILTYMLCGIALIAFSAPAFGADAKDADKKDEVYIKVEIVGILNTGIFAIGGETTGTTIKVNNVTWELELGGNAKFIELAEKLDGKTVLVKGTYRKVKGVEVKERHIVKVEELQEAK